MSHVAQEHNCPRYMQTLGGVMQVGGAMQVGADSGEEAISDTADRPARQPLGIEPFAVIHDEPYFSIVYDDGEFKGEIVDATIDRIHHAMAVADNYNLAISRVDYNDCSLVQMILTERGGPCP